MNIINSLLIFSMISLSSGHIITLTESNFVSLRGPVTSTSIAEVINKLIDIDENPINIYINSNGGSVDAGMRLVSYIKSLQELNVTVNCIADTALSMGFVIFQYCDNRYITRYATLMQHQMSAGGIGGKIREINSHLEYLNSIEDILNIQQAVRIGLTLEEFNKKIDNDWWLFSENAIKANVADSIVSMRCKFSNAEEQVKLSTMFGDIIVIYSKCPLVSNPIRIEFPKDFEKNDMEFISGSLHNNRDIYNPRYLDKLIEIVGPNFF
jgi:ATP-dependent Clp protease protease subunit